MTSRHVPTVAEPQPVAPGTPRPGSSRGAQRPTSRPSGAATPSTPALPPGGKAAANVNDLSVYTLDAEATSLTTTDMLHIATGWAHLYWNAKRAAAEHLEAERRRRGNFAAATDVQLPPTAAPPVGGGTLMPDGQQGNTSGADSAAARSSGAVSPTPSMESRGGGAHAATPPRATSPAAGEGPMGGARPNNTSSDGGATKRTEERRPTYSPTDPSVRPVGPSANIAVSQLIGHDFLGIHLTAETFIPDPSSGLMTVSSRIPANWAAAAAAAVHHGNAGGPSGMGSNGNPTMQQLSSSGSRVKNWTASGVAIPKTPFTKDTLEYVNLNELLALVLRRVSRWDLDRFFATAVPEDLLLALKGSLGTPPSVVFLPPESRWAKFAFEELTRPEGGRLSLATLANNGYRLGPLIMPLEAFFEASSRCGCADPYAFRASFFDCLRALFPRLPEPLLAAYGAVTPTARLCEGLRTIFIKRNRSAVSATVPTSSTAKLSTPDGTADYGKKSKNSNDGISTDNANSRRSVLFKRTTSAPVTRRSHPGMSAASQQAEGEPALLSSDQSHAAVSVVHPAALQWLTLADYREVCVEEKKYLDIIPRLPLNYDLFVQLEALGNSYGRVSLATACRFLFPNIPLNATLRFLDTLERAELETKAQPEIYAAVNDYQVGTPWDAGTEQLRSVVRSAAAVVFVPADPELADQCVVGRSPPLSDPPVAAEQTPMVPTASGGAAATTVGALHDVGETRVFLRGYNALLQLNPSLRMPLLPLLATADAHAAARARPAQEEVSAAAGDSMIAAMQSSTAARQGGAVLFSSSMNGPAGVDAAALNLSFSGLNQTDRSFVSTGTFERVFHGSTSRNSTMTGMHTTGAASPATAGSRVGEPASLAASNAGPNPSQAQVRSMADVIDEQLRLRDRPDVAEIVDDRPAHIRCVREINGVTGAMEYGYKDMLSPPRPAGDRSSAAANQGGNHNEPDGEESSISKLSGGARRPPGLPRPPGSVGSRRKLNRGVGGSRASFHDDTGSPFGSRRRKPGATAGSPAANSETNSEFGSFGQFRSQHLMQLGGVGGDDRASRDGGGGGDRSASSSDEGGSITPRGGGDDGGSPRRPAWHAALTREEIAKRETGKKASMEKMKVLESSGHGNTTTSSNNNHHHNSAAVSGGVRSHEQQQQLHSHAPHDGVAPASSMTHRLSRVDSIPFELSARADSNHQLRSGPSSTSAPLHAPPLVSSRTGAAAAGGALTARIRPPGPRQTVSALHRLLAPQHVPTASSGRRNEPTDDGLPPRPKLWEPSANRLPRVNRGRKGAGGEGEVAEGAVTHEQAKAGAVKRDVNTLTTAAVYSAPAIRVVASGERAHHVLSPSDGGARHGARAGGTPRHGGAVDDVDRFL